MATPLNNDALDLIPWETAPDLPTGNHAIEFRGGTILIPIRGYIDATEAELIRRADPQNGLFVLLTKAAASIVNLDADPEISPRAVYGFLLKLHAAEFGVKARLTDQERLWEVRHSELIADAMGQARLLNNRVAIAAATVMLRRVKPEWTEQQTERLPLPLISDLHAFQMVEERAGAPAADPAAEAEQLEDMLGKLAAATESIATGHDGQISSGNAAVSTLDSQSSAESGSESSPPASSLKRSGSVSRRNGRGTTELS